MPSLEPMSPCPACTAGPCRATRRLSPAEACTGGCLAKSLTCPCQAWGHAMAEEEEEGAKALAAPPARGCASSSVLQREPAQPQPAELP